MSDLMSVQRLVPSPPEPIFDLLADPDGHAEIDGGGTVKNARSGGRRLAPGDRFGMDMHLGVAYSTRHDMERTPARTEELVTSGHGDGPAQDPAAS